MRPEHREFWRDVTMASRETRLGERRAMPSYSMAKVKRMLEAPPKGKAGLAETLAGFGLSESEVRGALRGGEAMRGEPVAARTRGPRASSSSAAELGPGWTPPLEDSAGLAETLGGFGLSESEVRGAPPSSLLPCRGFVPTTGPWERTGTTTPAGGPLIGTGGVTGFPSHEKLPDGDFKVFAYAIWGETVEIAAVFSNWKWSADKDDEAGSSTSKKRSLKWKLAPWGQTGIVWDGVEGRITLSWREVDPRPDRSSERWTPVFRRSWVNTAVGEPIPTELDPIDDPDAPFGGSVSVGALTPSSIYHWNERLQVLVEVSVKKPAHPETTGELSHTEFAYLQARLSKLLLRVCG